MKKYFYNYQAITRFSKPVDRHYFLLRCMPCVNACQQTGKRELFIHPGGSVIYGADAWKNPIQYGCRMEEHDSFVFVSSGEIRLSPYRIAEDDFTDMFRVSSRLTALSVPMKQLLAGTEAGYPLERAVLLARNIHDYMHYASGKTGPETSAAEAFELREGVCQDYAHILIALCRASGIAARYVNGFIAGIGATHAWVEVLDNGCWWGIDPTHNCRIEYGYIKVAHGRDAMDCPVNRGVFTGMANQQTDIRVIVEEI